MSDWHTKPDRGGPGKILLLAIGVIFIMTVAMNWWRCI